MKVSKIVNPATEISRKVMNLWLKKCGAVIVAAGSASRMAGKDKIMELVGGEPLIVKTARAFQRCDAIAEIVIVTREDLVVPIMGLVRNMDKVKAVVVGGKDRVESVCLGLNALSQDVKLAAIHDGARPLVTWQLIDRVVRAAHAYGAAAPGVPVKDTVKIVAGGVVKSTPDRKTLQAIQTPQVFDYDLLRGALKQARDEDAQITDDCSAVERLGMSVKIVEGDERNLKVTTPMDLEIVRLLWEEQP